MKYRFPHYRDMIHHMLYPEIIEAFGDEGSHACRLIRHVEYYSRVYRELKERKDLYYVDANLKGMDRGEAYDVHVKNSEAFVRIIEKDLEEVPLYLNSPFSIVAFVSRWRLKTGI